MTKEETHMVTIHMPEDEAKALESELEGFDIDEDATPMIAKLYELL